jgi:hypothetical protein
MVILLQVGCVKTRDHEVTFQGHFQGPNTDQYRRTNSPKQGDLGYYRYLSGLVYPLSRDQRTAYIAATVQQILKFLEI